LKLKSGVTINRNDDRIRHIKSIEDVQKLHIFSHLDGEKKREAEEELLAAVQDNPLEDENQEEETGSDKVLGKDTLTNPGTLSPDADGPNP
jgi:hypothetical protein